MTPKPNPGRIPDVVVQRVRLRYAKRGRLRFTSHRDFARAFERALRRARVPMAYSAGFTPHPKVSYVGAAPTGVASEAEYLELALVAEVNPIELRAALDSALPAGLDVLEAVVAKDGNLSQRIEASQWRIELPGVLTSTATKAWTAFVAMEQVLVERLTKSGKRQLDARAAVLSGHVVVDNTLWPDSSAVKPVQPLLGAAVGDVAQPCAILEAVVRHVTPAVRPDDVLAGLQIVADLALLAPPRATRIAQGALRGDDQLIDPFLLDRAEDINGRHSTD